MSIQKSSCLICFMSILSVDRRMPHLSNEEFLSELVNMSKKTFSSGTVSISFKRCNGLKIESETQIMRE